MRKYALPAIGVSVYVIVTMIDILVVSLPMTMYVAALAFGALLVTLSLLGSLGFFHELLHTKEHREPTVFHIVRREPMLSHQYATK